MASERPSDPIRSFFLKVDGSKLRCIDCNYSVSNKIERLRNHRKRYRSSSCTTQLEPDLILEPSPQPSPIKRPKTYQPQMSSFTMKTDFSAAKQLNLQIARFFYACNIPFNVAENKEFKSMIALLRPGYPPPNRKDLSGPLLDTIHDQISEHILEQTRGKMLH